MTAKGLYPSGARLRRRFRAQVRSHIGLATPCEPPFVGAGMTAKGLYPLRSSAAALLSRPGALPHRFGDSV